MKIILPDKEYFSIGEVSKITQLPAYVLRYWETEFNSLRPQRRDSNHRKYTKDDIEKILEIKELLREKKYTIEGAKKIISSQRRKKKESLQMPLEFFSNIASVELLKETKKTLQELLRTLKG